MNLWLWAMLLCVIAVLAVVEFALLARRGRVVSPGEALAGTGLWLVAAGLVGRLVYVIYQNNWLGIQTAVSRPLDNVAVDGATALAQFVTVLVVESALSLDNIAVVSLMLAHHRVSPRRTGRVLYWAVTLALVVRLGLIFAVGPLSVRVEWLHYVFAGLLLAAATRTLLLPDSATDVSRGWLGGVLERTARWKWKGASGAGVVVAVAVADTVYAADFLPAAYSVTRDPFLAAAGNAFALLMLRSLYFTVAPYMGRFRYLKLTLVFILLAIVVGTVFFQGRPIQAEWMLGVVTVVLALGVTASVLVNRKKGLPTLPVGAVLDPHPATVEELAAGRGAGAGGGGAAREEVWRPAPIDDLVEAAAATRRNFRKVCILIAGTAVIIIGIVITPLPGPGPTVLVPIGIAILATEFIWAKRLLDNLKAHGDRLARTSDSISRRVPRWAAWAALPLWCAGWGAVCWALRDHGLWGKLALATAFGMSFPFAIWAWRLVRRKDD